MDFTVLTVQFPIKFSTDAHFNYMHALGTSFACRNWYGRGCGCGYGYAL